MHAALNRKLKRKKVECTCIYLPQHVHKTLAALRTMLDDDPAASSVWIYQRGRSAVRHEFAVQVDHSKTARQGDPAVESVCRQTCSTRDIMPVARDHKLDTAKPELNLA